MTDVAPFNFFVISHCVLEGISYIHIINSRLTAYPYVLDRQVFDDVQFYPSYAILVLSVEIRDIEVNIHLSILQ